MSQVVQSRCPHCRNTLRVPAEWLGKPMRCKLCLNVFAGQNKLAVNGITAAPARGPATRIRPAAAPTAVMPAPAGAAEPFGFEEPPTLARPRKAGGGNALVVVVGLILALPLIGLGLIAGGYVAYVHF